MNQFLDKFTEKAAKLAQNKFLKMIQLSFTSFAAITLGASLFNIVVSIPIPAYQTWLKSSGMYDILVLPNTISTNFMSILVCLGAGHAYASTFGKEKNAFAYSCIGLFAYLMISDLSTTATITTEAGEKLSTVVANVLPTSVTGSNGMLCALIISLVACVIYTWAVDRGFTIKMPETVPMNVTNMFAGMIPSAIVSVVLILIKFLFKLTPFGTMQVFIVKILQAPLTHVSGNLFGACVYWLSIKLFWFLGLHGGMVAGAVFGAITAVLGAANTEAFIAGAPVPYPEWLLHALQASMGLASLSILMAFFAKSEQYKMMGKLALPSTGLFNITEPMMFGVPIVLNFVFLVPFLLSPVITSLGMLGIMKLGLLNYPTGANITMFMPSPIGWALATADWRGALWAIVFYVVNMVLYYPFFKVADNMALKEEQKAAEAIQE